MAYVRGLLTNRPFRGVDEQFDLRLGDAIRSRAKTKPNLTICDIACGTEGTAIWDLHNQYPQSNGIGLDYNLSEEHNDDRIKLIKGDLFEIPFENAADVSYCAFVFADIPFWDLEEAIETRATATYQIAKTLKLNGVAFIDEGSFTATRELLDQLIERIDRLNPGYSNRFQTTNQPDIGLIGNHMVIHRLR